MADCLLALGSNLGDRRSKLDQCVSLFCKHPQIRRIAQSSYYATQPAGGPPDQETFLNGSLRIETSLSPHELLSWALGVERRLGRARHEHWGPRLIDIDLLLYDQTIIDAPELILPHPRMIVRRFVLEPALEIAAEMVHPTTGWSIQDLWNHLGSSLRYIPVAGVPLSGKTALVETLNRIGGLEGILERAVPLSMPMPITPPRLLDRLYLRESKLCSLRRKHLQSIHRRFRLRKTPDPRFVISDFWADQPLFGYATWYDGKREDERERTGGALPASRMIVLLDVPPSVIIERFATCVDGVLEGEILATISAWVDSYCQQLRDVAKTPGFGPVLHVRDSGPSAVAEVQAAVAAMET